MEYFEVIMSKLNGNSTQFKCDNRDQLNYDAKTCLKKGFDIMTVYIFNDKGFDKMVRCVAAKENGKKIWKLLE